ncbi:unnamed protein product [Peronospora farinosa]|uniref:Crinkler effector protein N-terminal domain-containing protein n=1 Tax=Peronospora farinosa TaxID=134698 RepID=A0ABN8BWA9_9STRA|nr:unnamed protein product [Peronospora farinosa]
MVHVTIVCAIIGKGNVFSVEIDDAQSMYYLRQAIEEQYEEITSRWDRLQFFLAKRDGKWLSTDDSDVAAVHSGDVPESLEALLFEKIDDKDDICNVFVPAPRTKEIHVLVKICSGEYIKLKDSKYTSRMNELKYYRDRGECIRRNCGDYCDQILNKIDNLYEFPVHPMPFICVAASSGMGKTQLAFALGGRRPWFYWPAISLGEGSQLIYLNFCSFSREFNSFTRKDDPMKKPEEDILDTTSEIYESEHLWTYGFIRALLEHCNSKNNRPAQMICFEEETSLYVEKCSRNSVVAARKRMGKNAVPFFILDEMSELYGGRNKVAFQRNVFRACGLVVIVMGTDANITKLASHYKTEKWMTLFARLPPYQPMDLVNEEKQAAWIRMKEQYPFLMDIVVNSRGRFDKYFVDKVAEFAMKGESVNLCDLLNNAFDYVGNSTYNGKGFMYRKDGKDAHLMATAYTNVDHESRIAGSTVPEPRPKKRKFAGVVGTQCMHVHFANLVEDQHIDVMLLEGKLNVDGVHWEPRCRFPKVEEDVLLYLAVVGGKDSLGDANHYKYKYSAMRMFSKGKKHITQDNRHALSSDFITFENMLAQAIFCASRRNGVRGIPFKDFFYGLLGEFQNEFKWMKMIMSDTRKSVGVTELVAGYSNLTALPDTMIPFLAPPNATWPRFIVETRDRGCNFGHLIRATNKNVYVLNMENEDGMLPFLCVSKHWDQKLHIGMMKEIILGLNSAWKEKWALVLVFCMKMTDIRLNWEDKSIGCVKISCQNGRVDWIFQPIAGHEKKLVVVMEMGPLPIFNQS